MSRDWGIHTPAVVFGLFILAVFPLGVWKLVEIVIWIASHVRWV